MAALPGATTEVVFSGERLGKPAGLWTSFAATASPEPSPAKIAYRLKLPSDAQVGIGAVRLLTSSGASSLTFFMVDDLPTLPREPAKHDPAQARPIPEAGAVEGACEPLTSDFYLIQGKRGRRLTIDVVANRLGSKLDPTIRLRSVDGRELAYCDDFPGLGPDCMLSHTFESDGKYVLEVRDANYQGGSQYYYRLRVGDFPLVTCAFPPAAERGSDLRHVSFESVAGRVEEAALKLPDTLSRFSFGVRYPGGMGSGYAALLAADAPDFIATAPNHEPSTAPHVSLPAAISGRFQSPDQRDYYAFTAKRGDRVSVRGASRSIGSAAELDIALLDSNGKKLPQYKSPVDPKKAAADATTAAPTFLDEPSYEADIPADGQYLLLARDLSNTGGTGSIYRLLIDHRPDFSLAASTDKLDIPPTGSARIKITCTRRKFPGPIRLSLANNTGWQAPDVSIPAGKSEAELEIRQTDPPSPNPAANLRIIGAATIAGSNVQHPASTSAALQKVYPRLRFIPPEFDTLIGIGAERP